MMTLLRLLMARAQLIASQKRAETTKGGGSEPQGEDDTGHRAHGGNPTADRTGSGTAVPPTPEARIAELEAALRQQNEILRGVIELYEAEERACNDWPPITEDLADHASRCLASIAHLIAEDDKEPGNCRH